MSVLLFAIHIVGRGWRWGWGVFHILRIGGFEKKKKNRKKNHIRAPIVHCFRFHSTVMVVVNIVGFLIEV